MTTPWTATVWDPDTGNHSIRSLYGLHPGDSSFGDSISGGSRITLNRGIDAIVRYILLYSSSKQAGDGTERENIHERENIFKVGNVVEQSNISTSPLCTTVVVVYLNRTNHTITLLPLG